jgi:hypothetical protein
VINIAINEIGFNNAVEQTAKEMQWAFQFMTNDLVLAKSELSWKNWGQYITIIRTEQNILFNSIFEPNKVALTSWGKNHKNRVMFEMFIEKQLN